MGRKIIFCSVAMSLLIMMLAGCSAGGKYGTVNFYSEPVEEFHSPESSFSLDLTKDEAAELKRIVDGVENWTDDHLVDRLPFWFDGEFELKGNDNPYHFAYKDNIVYCGSLFTQISDEEMLYIRMLDTSAQEHIVMKIQGEDVSAEWIEYAVKMHQSKHADKPAEAAIRMIKQNCRDRYYVKELSEAYDATYFDRLIAGYVENQQITVANASEGFKESFLKRSGVTLDEWQSVYLPRYDAPAAIYRQYAEPMDLELKETLPLEQVEVEILDADFIAAMEEKYPCTRDLSREFIDALVPDFEMAFGVDGTEVYSWYRYDTGQKAIVYGKTSVAGVTYEGEVYLVKDGDGWNIGDVNVISSTEKPLEVTGTLEQTNGDKKTDTVSYYVDRFNLLPELTEKNLGVIHINDAEKTLSLDMTISKYTNTGAIEGPRISFTVNLSDWEHPVVEQKSLLDDAEYVGPDAEMKQHSQSYYVIPDERVIEMAKVLYEYVPMNVEQ